MSNGEGDNFTPIMCTYGLYVFRIVSGCINTWDLSPEVLSQTQNEHHIKLCPVFVKIAVILCMRHYITIHSTNKMPLMQ